MAIIFGSLKLQTLFGNCLWTSLIVLKTQHISFSLHYLFAKKRSIYFYHGHNRLHERKIKDRNILHMILAVVAVLI